MKKINLKEVELSMELLPLEIIKWFGQENSCLWKVALTSTDDYDMLCEYFKLLDKGGEFNIAEPKTYPHTTIIIDDTCGVCEYTGNLKEELKNVLKMF